MTTVHTGGCPRWLQLLATIRRLQTELLHSEPFRDTSLIPNPGAKAERIANAELRLGGPLPPSYRAFLRRHDGWPRFFEGAALLGTRELGDSKHRELCEVLLRDSEPDLDEAPSQRSAALRFIPFAVDPPGMTLFAFDRQRVSPDGEMEVVAWIHELGMRRKSFTELLVLLRELCEADLERVNARDEELTIPLTAATA